MTTDEAIHNALDLNEAYKRCLVQARKCIREGANPEALIMVDLKRYSMAAMDALDDALQFVPKDILTQLTPVLGERASGSTNLSTWTIGLRWRFVVLTWRWRSLGIDEETLKVEALIEKWSREAE